ncbi:hypothetical protein SNEBB_010130 [Seison nebaliae]|nr:hypothetical protein SNEBB_010130 [Seison nebaliae]
MVRHQYTKCPNVMKMRQNLSDKETVKFFKCVSQEPVVWDISLDDYRNTRLRTKGWKRICLKMNNIITVEKARKRFKNLKGRYKRELKRLKVLPSSTTPVQSIQSNWKHLKCMNFMRELVINEIRRETKQEIKEEMADKQLANNSSPTIIDTEMNMMTFLKLIRQRQLLWNTNHDDYNNYERRLFYWNEIIQQLPYVMNATSAARKFHEMRLHFFRELKKIQLKRATNGETVLSPRWKLFKVFKELNEICQISEDVDPINKKHVSISKPKLSEEKETKIIEKRKNEMTNGQKTKEIIEDKFRPFPPLKINLNKFKNNKPSKEEENNKIKNNVEIDHINDIIISVDNLDVDKLKSLTLPYLVGNFICDVMESFDKTKNMATIYLIMSFLEKAQSTSLKELIEIFNTISGNND